MGAIVKPAATLLVICLVISASLAFTFAATKDRIAAGELAEANNAREEVMPNAVFEQVMGVGDTEVAKGYPGVTEIYKAFSNDDDGAQGAREPIGYVASVVTYGYGGEIGAVVGVSKDGNITGVRITRHSETPGLGANTAKPEFYGQFTGKQAVGALKVSKSAPANQDDEVAAVSGATISSTAVTNAVNAAVLAIRGLE